MNPYAKYLGGRAPLEIIASTSNRLEELVQELGPVAVERPPAEGKWSPREIIGHLADCEIVFGVRLRQALTVDSHVVQPFDQEKWAGVTPPYQLRQALDAFQAVREWNRILIAGVPSAAYSRKLVHPERGEMTFQDLLETIAGHDRNHLEQLEKLAGNART